jgi:hypothetical protein
MEKEVKIEHIRGGYAVLAAIIALLGTIVGVLLNNPKEKTNSEPVNIPSQSHRVLVNHTSATLEYVLNDEVFKIEPGAKNTHKSNNGDFFLKFDSDLSEVELPKKYSLEKGLQYGFYSHIEDFTIDFSIEK